MIKDEKCLVMSNTEVVPGIYLMHLKTQELHGLIRSGNFINLKLPGSEFALRRPFSVFDYGDSSIKILYKVIGKGTEVMSSLKEGTELMVMGPLGNRFEEFIDPDKKSIVMGAGIGLASVTTLIKSLIGKGLDPEIYYGINTANENVIESLGMYSGRKVHLSVMDGSAGFKGNLVELLMNNMPDDPENLQIFACGPEIFYINLQKALQGKGISCYCSFEERMGCGFGVCLGCAINVNGSYKKVCEDGTIFNLEDIKYE